MKFIFAFLVMLVSTSVFAEPLTIEQQVAVRQVKAANVDHGGKAFKLKDGSEVSLAELELLMQMGFDITQMLESTAAGQSSESQGIRGSSSSVSSSAFGATPSSSFNGGGGKAASRN